MSWTGSQRLWLWSFGLIPTGFVGGAFYREEVETAQVR
jgi:hypothetical protein